MSEDKTVQEEKNKYVAPVAIPLGELARGSGQCTPGSGVVAACSFGGNAEGNCGDGGEPTENCADGFGVM